MAIQVPEWEELARALTRRGAAGTVYLLGATDTGKTTLASFLLDTLGERTAYLDADAGQAALGPPGTLGVALPGGEVRLRFTGALTPTRALDETFKALEDLLGAAYAAGAETVIVDSCGYVEGRGGVAFQRRSVATLRPDHIVAIQREKELEPVLGPFKGRFGPKFHRIPPSSHAKERSRGERRRYREKRFAAYMEGAVRTRLSPDLQVRGEVPEDPTGTAAAVCDAAGWALAVGVVEAIDEEGITFLAPPPVPGVPAYLMMGQYRPGRRNRPGAP
ncbi:hypothetical protein E2N92_05235 [Methanofollis formosanus]|uniref:polynucleotide 5'-hydroxyl-kinase n=1 Tax=Methanofollis formosanus TaxID=299308 RepID=A0A8G1EG75_9EURY|nr:Clp1/GlmU family protein [Methanofollis formosanus]QYZ78869.1 hypothetical protein E2N92_05235 [Methanofollis formosanus]